MSEQTDFRYLSLPKSGRGAGVLVLHPWWGLNDFIRNFCDRLSQEGFVVLAPDLYSGKIAHTIEEAEQLRVGWDEEKVVPPILLSAVEHLSRHPAVTGLGLGTVGLSMGGFWAFWLSQEKPEFIRAVSTFYATNGGWGDFLRSNASYLCHFAEMDPYEPVAGVDEMEKSLKAANRPAEFYTYPRTGHWFFESDRSDAFHPQAAQLAWERTVSFLHTHLDK